MVTAASSPHFLGSQALDLPSILWRRGCAYDSRIPRRSGRAIRRVQFRQQVIQIVRHLMLPAQVKIHHGSPHPRFRLIACCMLVKNTHRRGGG